MQRSTERYLVYFLIMTAVGSMLLIYGFASWPETPVITYTALAIVAFMLVMFITVLLQRKKR